MISRHNFFKLFIKAQKDEQGRIATGQSKGFISYPGEAELHEVALFSGSPLVGAAPEIVEGEFSEAEDDVSDDEIFRKLVQEDGFSKSEASQQVFGKPYAGSSHVLRCRQVLNATNTRHKKPGRAAGFFIVRSRPADYSSWSSSLVSSSRETLLSVTFAWVTM